MAGEGLATAQKVKALPSLILRHDLEQRIHPGLDRPLA
jgi:hypothetical protein